MKKKLTASVLCLALLLIMLLGSTLAWFTDESGATNTMTVGNVKIQQYQKDRSNNAFDPVQKMFPAVINNGLGGTVSKQDGFWNTNEINNEIDNIVTVENIGSEAAYVRTLFAFEMMKKVTKDTNGNDVITWENPLTNVVNDPAEVVLNVNETVDQNGNPAQFIDFATGIVIYQYNDATFGGDSSNAVAAYVIGIYTYKEALAASTTTNPSISAPSLLQFYLAGHVNNDFSAAVGGHYDILVLSQAVQEAGFTSADLAFNAALPLNVDNLTAWFTPLAPTPNP